MNEIRCHGAIVPLGRWCPWCGKSHYKLELERKVKKFKVEITQHAYRNGFYIIEAPDEDAAYTLAEDIKFEDPRITWDEFAPNMANYPKLMDIFVSEP